MNKQAAHQLGISEITVKAHRGRMMQKMKARSFADLVNMNANNGSRTLGQRSPWRSRDDEATYQRGGTNMGDEQIFKIVNKDARSVSLPRERPKSERLQSGTGFAIERIASGDLDREQQVVPRHGVS